MGVTFDAAMVFSAFAGPSYTLTGYTTSAPYLEGNTFDNCGGHSSSTSKASYHYHVAPSCLLAQLGQTDGTHSPQVGWMADGFPLYGPLGPSGTAMKTCTVTGGTVGTDTCLDDCGGYYGDTGDGYMYRYYMQGTFNDGKCTEMPAQTPGGGSDYYPFTPLCLRGCCPSGVSCSMGSLTLPTCSGSSTGTASSFAAAGTSALAINSQARRRARWRLLSPAPNLHPLKCLRRICAPLSACTAQLLSPSAVGEQLGRIRCRCGVHLVLRLGLHHFGLAAWSKTALLAAATRRHTTARPLPPLLNARLAALWAALGRSSVPTRS